MASSNSDFQLNKRSTELGDFVMSDYEIDPEFISESFDFINQLPIIKRNPKSYNKITNQIKVSKLYNNPLSSKYAPVKNKVTTDDIKKKMEKIVHQGAENLEEKFHRQVGPKSFCYFSNKSKSLNSLTNLIDDKGHRMALRRSPSVSPEIQNNLVTVSLNTKNLSKSAQTNLFFPLLIRKNHSTSLITSTKNSKPTKPDPNGSFFVQSISYLKPKNVK
ncbi:unnamed protein product [Brachionus calyciflorus]|uniref:Uncharacterized protein n=1 Tax=Brachionus calyciflorus TaxID=104777 RepID=A0A813M4L0_9BILA|nr:unnamed protein product [Brachionus calyciflorus]